MSYIPNMMNPMGINNNNMGMGMNIPQMNMNMSTYQQPQQNQQQQSNQQQTNMNFVVVENMQRAKEQIVPYGYTVWMRDSSEPYQYIKSVDLTGTPSFKVLKVEDVTEQMVNGNNNQNKQTDQFVPIQDFNALNSKVEQLQNTVNYYSNMLNQVITPNNNTVIDVEPKELKKVGRPPKTDKVGES